MWLADAISATRVHGHLRHKERRAWVRHVVGNECSIQSESFGVEHPGLEGPQYTRPEEFRGWRVPEILLSGHHGNVESWNREQSLKRTEHARPDLLTQAKPL